MSIPRVLVDVEGRDGGWAVRVREPWAGPRNAASAEARVAVLAEYGLAAVTVTDADGWPRRVPVLPPHRLAQLGGSAPAALTALCAGDVAAISGLLTRITGRDLRAGDAELYGRWLFECLLAPAWPRILAGAGAGAGAGAAAAAAAAAGAGAAGHGGRRANGAHGAYGVELALRWSDEDHALGSLVWEAMHDGIAPLVGHPRVLVAVTRVVPGATPAPTTIRRVPRVLFAAGSALDDAVIRPGAMFMGLIRAFEAEGLCVSRAMTSASLADLGETCARFAPDVVHLVAHGDVADGRAAVRLADADEPAGLRYVDAEALAMALRRPGGMPIAVILSACGSARPPGAGDAAAPEPHPRTVPGWPDVPGGDAAGGEADGGADGARAAGRSIAAELARRGVPVVVAMSGEVSEQASRLFTRRFVRAVQHGASVVGAAAAGRRAALLNGDPPSRYLDWAMPTLFLAESVPPDLRIVDPTSVAELLRAAESLELRRTPMFIGHEAILTAADALADPALERCPGLVAAVTEGPITGLGGSRLLREIGLRLLRAGHVPLLIGPFGDGGAPRDLRGLAARILEKVVMVAEVLEIDPPPLTALGVDRSCRLAAAVTAEALRARDREDGLGLLYDAVAEFEAAEVPLNEHHLRRGLARDLAALADAAVALGEPFGRSTRVVLLGDEVHRWVGALRPLLSMIRRDGLGSPSRPVPVVVTASLLADEGVFLRQLRDERAGQPGFLFPELTRMSPASAILGFQWVLLHPWLERYPEVYTAAPSASRMAIEQSLGELNGLPTAVRSDLYLIANALKYSGVFLAADDERALRTYEERFP
jgi:hypothetical protein